MKNLHHHIFSETTCISKETMLKFINKQLSQKELHDVQIHLLDCDLCSEALEGMQHAKNPSVLFNIDHQIASRTQQKTTSISRIILVAASLLLIVAGSYFTITNFNDAAVKDSELAYEEPAVASKQAEEQIFSIQTPSSSTVSSENKQETSNKNTNIQAQQVAKNEQLEESAMSDDVASGNAISQTFSSKERIATEVAEAEDAVADNILFEEPAVATKKDAKKEVDFDANKSLAFSSDKKAEKPSKNKTRAKTTQAPSPAAYAEEDAELEKKEVQTVVTDEEVNIRTENTSYTTTTTGGLTTAASTVSEENHLAEGKASYENKDYITAIHHFDIILAKPKTTNETYEAKWFKALCFIGLNDNTTAKKLLNELVQVNNPFSKKAEEKLKVLK